MPQWKISHDANADPMCCNEDVKQSNKQMINKYIFSKGEIQLFERIYETVGIWGFLHVL